MEGEGLPPRPTSTKLGSLSPASLPKAWAFLPASFHHISFNTPKEPAAPPFLLLGFTLLPPLYQGGGSLSVPASPLWAFLRCPLQAQQESPTPLWGHLGSHSQSLGTALSLSSPQSSLAVLPGPDSILRSHLLPMCSFASAQLGPERTAFGHLWPQVTSSTFS